MKRLDYMLLCLSKDIRHVLENKDWWVRCFAKVPLVKESEINEHRSMILQPTLTGVYFFYQGNKYKVDDIKNPKEGRFFSFDESVKVTPTLFENVDKTTDTTLGNAIINALAILPSFGNKLKYLDGILSVGQIEHVIHQKLIDDPEEGQPDSTTDIHVKEYIDFIDRLTFLTNLADIINFTGTEKVMLAPPGLKEKKKELLDKYEDKMDDPVVLRHVEAELQKLDEEYLKDDPSNNKFLSGKSKNVARKKMVLIFGAEKGFEQEAKVEPVTRSLLEGIDTSEEKFPNYLNASRAGSYSRGSETVNGGVVSKMLLRAMGSMSISPEDCGTKKGLTTLVTEKMTNSLLTRTMKVGSQWKEIETDEQANGLVGKKIELRSPLYCKSPGLSYCGNCLNHSLRSNPNGISISISEVSSIILNMFMGAMHGKELKTTDVPIEDLIN